MPPGAWDKGYEPGQIPDGAKVYVGIDMALYHDSTAVVVAWPHPSEDGRTVIRVESKIWAPEDSGGRIDFQAVREHLRALNRKYNVKQYAGDPKYLEIIFQELLDEGLPMSGVFQSPERMVPACGNAYQLIVSGMVEHDGSSTLTDHVLSAVQQQSDRGWRLSKSKSKRPIDGAIALVMALYEATHEVEDKKSGQLLYLS